MTKKDWFKQMLHVAPMILALTPFAPIAPAIAAGIVAVEKMQGVSGAEKLARVQELAHIAAEAANAQAGRELVSVVGIDSATAKAIGTIVDIVNLTHRPTVG